MVGFTERLALMKESTQHREALLSEKLGFAERVKLMKRRTEIKELLAGGTIKTDEPTVNEESELIRKFKAREFNGDTSESFIQVMRDVHADGLELDEIKAGALSWLEENQKAA